MEVNQLRYFVKLSETLNFSKAAEELFITQPSLSAQINLLEEELGVKLFMRTTRKVELTEIGQQCLAPALAALHSMTDIENIAKEYIREDRSTLRIGILTILPHEDILGAITQFQKENPQINVKLHFGWSKDLIELLTKRELDVVISNIFADYLTEDTELDISPFIKDRLVLVVSKQNPLAAQKYISIPDFLGEKLWVVDPNSSVIVQLRQEIEKAHLRQPELNVTGSIRSMMKMVGSNLGATVLSHGVAKEYRTSDVKSILIVPRINTSTAVISLKSGVHQETISKIKEFFAGAFSAP